MDRKAHAGRPPVEQSTIVLVLFDDCSRFKDAAQVCEFQAFLDGFHLGMGRDPSGPLALGHGAMETPKIKVHGH